MTGGCCVATETIGKARVIEDDDIPTVLIVAVCAGTAVMVGWRSVAALAVG
jgi:hypothetical protein